MKNNEQHEEALCIIFMWSIRGWVGDVLHTNVLSIKWTNGAALFLSCYWRLLQKPCKLKISNPFLFKFLYGRNCQSTTLEVYTNPKLYHNGKLQWKIAEYIVK